MGKSVSAVTMLLHRGRRRLRQTLGVTAGGFGLWRWLRQYGMPQVAVAKGAAAIVVAGGLATTGVVAARVIAPVGAETAAAAPATHSGSLAEGAERTPGAVLMLHAGSRHFQTTGGSSVNAVTQGLSGADATPATIGSSTTAGASSLLPSTAGVPTVSVPTVAIPTPPVTVAATVTVSTPITSVTVTTPTGTTATVTTPITTVTVPIP
jgi:hypothetical protein